NYTARGRNDGRKNRCRHSAGGASDGRAPAQLRLLRRAGPQRARTLEPSQTEKEPARRSSTRTGFTLRGRRPRTRIELPPAVNLQEGFIYPPQRRATVNRTQDRGPAR